MPLCFQAVETLNEYLLLCQQTTEFLLVSAVQYLQSTLLSVYLAVTFSFSGVIFPFPSLPLHLSLAPSGPLLWPINRSVGGDGGPLRETEHFG